MDEPTASGTPTLEPGDFYLDGDYMVFTEQYHLKRGSCCGSRCKHCPYGLAPDASEDHYQRPEPEVAGG